jgi:hypothetical protein
MMKLIVIATESLGDNKHDSELVTHLWTDINFLYYFFSNRLGVQLIFLFDVHWNRRFNNAARYRPI